MNASDRKLPKWLMILAAVGVAAAGSLPFLLFPEAIQKMAAAGYAGLMAACCLTNATVFLPASGIAFTLSASTALDPLLCCVAGGCGTACGELVGYFCGRSGKRLVTDRPLFSKIEHFLSRYGFFTVLAFAFLPIPAFDLVGVTAGAGNMPVYRYLSACIIGKVLKMIVYVFLFSRILNAL